MKCWGISVGDVGSPAVEVSPVSGISTTRFSSVRWSVRAGERLLVMLSSLIGSVPLASITSSGSRQSNRFEGTAAMVDRDTLSVSEQREAVMKRHTTPISRRVIITCTTSTGGFTHMKRSEGLVVGGRCMGNALGVVADRCVEGCGHLY